MTITRLSARTCLIALGGAIALASCSSTAGILAESELYASQHKFYRAYWVLASSPYPDDPEVQRVFWQRRLDYLLEQGRNFVFDEEEERAILEFQKALALDPANADALAWIDRANQKVAKRAAWEGDSRQFDGDYVGALRSYNKAFQHVPDYEAATKGIEKLRARHDTRAANALEHYVLGSRARGEEQHQQSHYQSGIATHMDETLAKAQRLHKKSGKELASERLAAGLEMQETGFYAAALQQYESVHASLPKSPGLNDRIEQMKNEVDARQKCRLAEMLVRKEEFDEADELLVDAFALTEHEKATVSGLMHDSKRRRFELAYQKAKDLALDYEFEAALKAFVAIDEAWPSRGFLDVKTRISSLTSAVEIAREGWAEGQKAENAGDIKGAIEHYKRADNQYPGYKGVDKRLVELRTRL